VDWKKSVVDRRTTPSVRLSDNPPGQTFVGSSFKRHFVTATLPQIKIIASAFWFLPERIETRGALAACNFNENRCSGFVPVSHHNISNGIQGRFD